MVLRESRSISFTVRTSTFENIAILSNISFDVDECVESFFLSTSLSICKMFKLVISVSRIPLLFHLNCTKIYNLPHTRCIRNELPGKKCSAFIPVQSSLFIKLFWCLYYEMWLLLYLIHSYLVMQKIVSHYFELDESKSIFFVRSVSLFLCRFLYLRKRWLFFTS